MASPINRTLLFIACSLGLLPDAKAQSFCWAQRIAENTASYYGTHAEAGATDTFGNFYCFDFLGSTVDFDRGLEGEFL